MKIRWHGNGYRERREAARMRSLHKKELLEQERLNLKSELNRFWAHCNRLDMTPDQRLSRLKEFAEVVIVKPEGFVRRFKRTYFIHSRCRRSKMCFGCDRAAWVRHHIIQLQNGGSNSKENIVSLCVKCHAEIHPWLKKPSKPEVVDKLPITPEKISPPETAEPCSQLFTIRPKSCEPDIIVPFNELTRDGDGY